MEELTNIQLANAIFAELGIDTKITDENQIYDDEFFVSVISYIVPENSFDIKISDKKEKKAENLCKLIEFLSGIVEIDLQHIDPEAIIYKKDKVSAKHLLELIFELILVLKKEQMAQEGEEIEDDEDNEAKEQYEEDEDKIYSNDSQKFQNKEKRHHSEEIHHLTDDFEKNETSEKGNISESYLKNEEESQHLEESQQVYSKAEESFKEKETSERQDHRQKSELNPSENENNSNLKSVKSENLSQEFVLENQKSCPDLIFVDENNEQSDTSINKYNLKPNYTHCDLSRYIYEQNLIELFQQQQQQLQDENNEGNYEFGNYIDKKKDMNDEDKDVQISRISEVSHSKENSEQHIGNQKQGKGKKDDKKGASFSVNESQKPSKLKNSSSKFGENDYNNEEEEQDHSKKFDKKTESINIENSIKNQSEKESLAGGSRSSVRSDKVKSKKESGSKNTSKISKKQQIQYEEESKKKGKSDKENQKKPSESKNTKKEVKKDEKAGAKRVNKSNSISKSQSRVSNNEISMSSMNSAYQQSENRNQNNQKATTNQNDENYEDVPYNHSELKARIMKDIKRLYGNKFDKLFLKEISTNDGLFENMLKTFKLARDKMAKFGNDNEDKDDKLSKECLEKLRKKEKFILDYYLEEQRKREFLKKKSLMNITKNTNVLRKVQEIENERLQKEIERKKQARELKKKEDLIKFSKRVYQQTVEFERQKYFEDKKINDEFLRQYQEDRRRNIEQIEKYYQDKIDNLREILQREKFEREIEYRAYIQYFSKIQRETKRDQREKIEKMLNRLDDQDKNFENKNMSNEKIEQILSTYYKYS